MLYQQPQSDVLQVTHQKINDFCDHIFSQVPEPQREQVEASINLLVKIMKQLGEHENSART